MPPATHHRKLTIIMTISCTIAVVAGGASGEPQPAGTSPGPTAAESQKANAFFDKVFHELLARSPQFETRLGIKAHYDQWDDRSDAFSDETRRIVERHLGELERTVDPSRLDAATRLSYDLFVDEWERRIRDDRWHHHNYPCNQMYGLQSEIPSS